MDLSQQIKLLIRVFVWPWCFRLCAACWRQSEWMGLITASVLRLSSVSLWLPCLVWDFGWTRWSCASSPEHHAVDQNILYIYIYIWFFFLWKCLTLSYYYISVHAIIHGSIFMKVNKKKILFLFHIVQNVFSILLTSWHRTGDEREGAESGSRSTDYSADLCM